MIHSLFFKSLAAFLAATAAALAFGSPVPNGVAGDSQAKITWATPPASILGVDIDESLDSGNTWTSVSRLPPTDTRVNVQGLTNGKNYWFRVRWVWTDGTFGVPSPTFEVTPIGNPNTPTGLAATADADQVALSWDPDPDKTIIGYEIDQSTDDGTTWTVYKANTGSPGSGYLLSGLAVGKIYTFRIRALGFGGAESDFSDNSSVQLAPSASSDGFALNYTIVASKVTLTWDTPTDLSDVQTYLINVSGDGGVNWYPAATTQGGINTAAVPYVIGGSAYQVIATSSTGQTSSSQIQLVETNLIPDPVSSGTPTPSILPTYDPNAGPTSTPTDAPTVPASTSKSSSSPIIPAAGGLVVVIGGIVLFANSRKNKRSKGRYKPQKRKAKKSSPKKK